MQRAVVGLVGRPLPEPRAIGVVEVGGCNISNWSIRYSRRRREGSGCLSMLRIRKRCGNASHSQTDRNCIYKLHSSGWQMVGMHVIEALLEIW